MKTKKQMSKIQKIVDINTVKKVAEEKLNAKSL